MSKFGDDLIQSLKEALAHAGDNGPGTEHVPESLRSLKEVDAQTEANSATNDSN